MNTNLSTSKAIHFAWHEFWGNWKFWLIVNFIFIGIGSSGFRFTNSGVKTDDARGPSPVIYNRRSLDSPKNVLGVNTTVVQSETLPTTPKIKKILPFLFVLIPYGVITFVLVMACFILMLAANAVVKMGYIHLTLDVARGGARDYKQLLSDVNIKKSLKLILIVFLYFLLVLPGLVFFIIPGIYFGIKYMFAPVIFIDKNTKIGEAFKQSGQITKHNMLKLFGMFWVSTFFVIIGLLSFIVGVIPASIIISLMFSYTYVILAGELENKEVGATV